jgi:hypothetical protein
LAYTVTFPSAGPCPDPTEVEAWLTELGEPFEEEGPHTLQLRALPVRLVVIPEDKGFQAHIDVTTGAPLVRLVDLLFALSMRAGTDVRLAGFGALTRPSLWLHLAEEQDRHRLARAIELAEEQGKKETVVRGMWAVLAAASPGRDVRWDAARKRIVELKEVGVPDGVTVEEASWHVEDPTAGDVIAIPVEGSLHLIAWRWLSAAHPALTEL